MSEGTPDELIVRPATAADIDTLVRFTLDEAREAEGRELDAPSVRRGVEGGFADPPLATYWVAEGPGGIVAATSVVTEWSNFAGGHYWWIQSLYISPAHRGTGLVGRLLDHLAECARAANALDLRLYAHAGNRRALAAYRRHGFADAPYVMMIRRFASRAAVPGSRRVSE